MLGINIQPSHLQSGLDVDVRLYINAVQLADGQSLEPAVITAINNFVVGCKADGNFDKFQHTALLCGARTLAGALVPLVGASQTNNGFVEADYSRTLGLQGATGKTIDTNFNAQSLTTNDNHHFIGLNHTVWTSSGIITSAGGWGTDGTMLYRFDSVVGKVRVHNAYLHTDSTVYSGGVGLYGSARNSSAGYYISSDTAYGYKPKVSQPYVNDTFAYGGTNVRFDIHTVGRYINSADYFILEARVATLKSDIATALT